MLTESVVRFENLNKKQTDIHRDTERGRQGEGVGPILKISQNFLIATLGSILDSQLS